MEKIKFSKIELNTFVTLENAKVLVINSKISGFGSGKKTVYSGTLDGMPFELMDSEKLNRLIFANAPKEKKEPAKDKEPETKKEIKREPEPAASVPAVVPAPAKEPAASGAKTTPETKINPKLAVLLELLNDSEKSANFDEAGLLAKVEKMIDEKLNARPAAGVVHEIKINNEPTTKVDGILHDNFDDVLFWVKNNEPVYLYGPAGTGKNVLSEQIAKALNLPFYYAGCLQQKYELEGFVNAAGEYQSTEFYKAFTEGGVFLFDEIDGTAAEVLVAFNAALANRYYEFPKYGRIVAHPNFKVIAAGNTNGRGANDTYNGRFQLDASTLDRFVFEELEYNDNIQLAAAGGDKEMVFFANRLRQIIEDLMLPYTVSPRALKRIALGLKNNMPVSKLLKTCLCGSWSKDDIKLIAGRLNREGGNRYSNAFINLYK